MIRPVRPDGKIETGGVFVPIVRRRVVDRIASAAMQRVVLIVAPAGYGKSVALRHYLDTLAEPHLRYDVLGENAGLLGFLRGFADAVAEIAPDARGTLAGAYEKNAGAQSPGATLRCGCTRICARIAASIAIDDLHVAQGDREVARFLTSLIERTKGRVQWIIASRATSGLPIGTWLAYGESDLAIDEHDLKFSVEEAKEAARAFQPRRARRRTLRVAASDRRLGDGDDLRDALLDALGRSAQHLVDDARDDLPVSCRASVPDAQLRRTATSSRRLRCFPRSTST